MQLVAATCVGLTLGLSSPTSSSSTIGSGLALPNTLSGPSIAEVAANTLPPSRSAEPGALIAELPAPPIAKSGAETNAQLQPAIGEEKVRAQQFIQPVEGFPLTSGFGNRKHPISGDVRPHRGVDFGTPKGTPIRAAKQGVVSFADWHGGYGKAVIIDHAAEYETLYAHLDELWVGVGELVAQGEIIGLSGSTGYSTGPHLHFEIRAHQVARDPMKYFSAVGEGDRKRSTVK